MSANLPPLDPELALELSEEAYQAVRAELAALRAENARLMELLGESQLYVLCPAETRTKCSDCIQLVDCGTGKLREAIEAVLSGAPHEAKGARAGIFLTLEQAREIEWARSGYCPALCGGLEGERGHAPDCWLGNAIKQAEEGKRCQGSS